MTCSTRFRRLLQASCLGLIGTLTVVGCGGSDTTKRDTGVLPPVVDSGIPGSVKVDQVALLFGNVDIGTPSAPKTVTATVTGAPVALNATVTGDGFAISENKCLPVQPVGTCTISVVFAPTRVGAASGSLAVGANSVALSGTGIQPGVFTVTPEAIPLGTKMLGESAPAVVTITPVGTVASLSCLANGADLSLTTQTCPATGPVSAACSYTFTFRATTPGEKVESIVCSGAGTVRNVSVTANVITPSVLGINPTKQDLTAKVGQSVPWTFTVSNAGGASTGTLSTAITGAGFAITQNDCPPQLAGGGICKIQIAFAPTVAGKVTGSLTVTDATPGSVPAVAALTGNAIDSAIVITPNTKDFGSVTVGAAPGTAAFTMDNTGTSATDIIALAPSDAQFAVVNDLCSGHTLAAKAQCTFSVNFAPASAGKKQAMLNATQTSDGAVLATVSLTGTGVAAPKPATLVITPPTLDFGTTGVGVPVGPKTFTITNDGEVASGPLTTLKNDSTSSVGGASQFNITGNTCAAALAPKATCQVAVTFAPTITRSASAVIVVSDGVASTSTATAGIGQQPGTVVGIALAIPTLVVECNTASVDLSVYPSPFTSAGTVVGDNEKVVCTVTNTVSTGGGDTPQESGAITITPTSNNAATGTFTVGTNNCTASLQPNTSCTFELVFTPLAKGITQGSVSIASSNRGANNQRFSGLGLLPVQIVMYLPSAETSLNPNGVVENYDFGQVAQGGSSDQAPLNTTITVAVYVRKQIGNLAISGTNLYWPAVDTAKSDFSIVGAAMGQAAACQKVASSVALGASPKTIPNCTALLTFTPQKKGAVSTTITALGGDGTTDTAAARGTGTGPLTIQPSPATFDAVGAGSSSRTLVTLTICNHAQSNAQQAAMTITGDNPTFFAVVDDLDTLVTNRTIPAAGGPTSPTCVKPTFRLNIPAGTAVGAISAKLGVTAVIAGVNESASADLVGSVGGSAALTATLGGQFAATPITNISPAVVLTVTNTGAVATDALNFRIPNQNGPGVFGDFFFKTDFSSSDGRNATQFGLIQGTCAPNANGESPKLNPGDSCTLNLWFYPSAGLGAVARNSLITVSSAVGGLVVVPLTATATPQLTISPEAVDFGTWPFLEPAATYMTITLTNHGAVTIATPATNLQTKFVNAVGQTGASITPPDGSSKIFKKIAGTCTTMATLGKAGDTSIPNSCTYTLQLYDTEGLLVGTVPNPTNPPAPGLRETTFEVTNAVNGTQKATTVLRGTPVAAPNLVFTAASQVDVDFGNVPLSNPGQVTPSRSVKFTVKNVGGIAASQLTYDFYTINDAYGVPANSKWPKATDIQKSGCTGDAGRLAPGASCDITVAFAPTRCPASDPTCRTTTTLAAQLKVKYTLGGTEITLGDPTTDPNLAPALTVQGVTNNAPVIRGTALDTIGTASVAPSAYIEQKGDGGPAPYDFGWLTTASTTVTLAVKNASGTSAITIAGPVTLSNVAGVNVLGTSPPPAFAPDTEFTITADGATGACNLTGAAQVLAPGGNCTFLATWANHTANPGYTREVRASFASTSGTGAVAPSINIFARNPAVAKLVAISPLATSGQPLDFGYAVINKASPAINVTLQNQGEVETGTLQSVHASGTNEFTGSGCTANVVPGATCVLAVTVDPGDTGAGTTIGPEEATVVRTANTAHTPMATLWATFVPVYGAELVPSPEDTINFDALTSFGFGTPVLASGAAATAVTIALDNVANSAETGPMTFKTDTADFVINLNPAASTCLAPKYAFHGLAPMTTPSDHQCNVVVVFSPTALANPAKSGHLIVTSANAPELSIPLGGAPTATTPATATAVSSLAATAATGGTFTTATKTAAAKLVYQAAGVSNPASHTIAVFTITKAEGAPVTGLLSTSITGTNAADFRIIEDNCVGESLYEQYGGGTAPTCTVSVRFVPGSTGAGKTATLTVQDPTSGTPVQAATVTLTGDANAS